MSSTIRTSTVVYASIGTLLTGALAYAVYFDHRRRTDAEFRRQLKRDSKKLAKASKVEAESSKKQERQELRDMVDEANEDGFPTDADEKEAFFMQEVGQGEVLCQQGECQRFGRGKGRC
jgi:import receptor subunit TOM20